MRAAALFLLLISHSPVARAGDALTGSLERTMKNGTTGERKSPANAPVQATIDGVLLRDCAVTAAKTPCDPFYYIVLPKQLDELMTGRTPMNETTCAEKGMPRGCAKSVQIHVADDATLAALVGHRVSAVGSISDHQTPADQRPAVMRAASVKDLGPNKGK